MSKQNKSYTLGRNGTLCAYCGKPATSRDHIPPKSLFLSPRPENLITVPACAECNNGASSDDTVFRDELSIMAGSFGESAPAAELRKSSLRSIQRTKQRLKRIVTEGRLVERYSPGGIFLGKGYIVPMPPEARVRVLTRIVRGLHWHHYGNSLNVDRVKLVPIDKDRKNWKESLSWIWQSQHVSIGNGDTFQYVYGRVEDDPALSFWLMVFFQGPSEKIYFAHAF
jgi:hypothetical protein